MSKRRTNEWERRRRGEEERESLFLLFLTLYRTTAIAIFLSRYNPCIASTLDGKEEEEELKMFFLQFLAKQKDRRQCRKIYYPGKIV